MPISPRPDRLTDATGAVRIPAALLMLRMVTGVVDAVSFLGLGHVFTANMTGNIVFLAFALAGASDLSVRASAVGLAGFLVGAAAGGRAGLVFSSRSRRRWLTLTGGVETVLLGVATLCAVGVGADSGFGRQAPVITLTAVAMGWRNATVRRLGVADMTTTVLTLTLTGLAADSSVAGGTNPHPVRRLGSVLAMFAGALVGALLVLHVGLAWPLTVAALLAAGATSIYGVTPEQEALGGRR
jgi:uncharacterized membrane protein YoaK (UPF0700 family)